MRKREAAQREAVKMKSVGVCRVEHYFCNCNTKISGGVDPIQETVEGFYAATGKLDLSDYE